jgi:hypothetical protein
VHRPHFFDRHPSGTLEAEKLRARVNSVKSGVAHGDANPLIPSRRRLLCCHGRARATISSGILFLLSLGHARFFFLVKKIFGRDENKISNKFIFFLSILKAISSLKPAGERESRTHVNKL